MSSLPWPTQQTRAAALNNPGHIITARALLCLADSCRIDRETIVARFVEELRARVRPKRGVDWPFLAAFYLACARTHDRLYDEIAKLQLLAHTRPHQHETGFDYDMSTNRIRASCYENDERICPGCCDTLKGPTRILHVPIVDTYNVQPLADIFVCAACDHRARRLAGASA